MDFFSFLCSFNFPFVYSSQHTKMSGFFGRGGANFFQMEILMSCITRSDRRYHADLITRNKILKLDKKVECFQNSK